MKHLIIAGMLLLMGCVTVPDPDVVPVPQVAYVNMWWGYSPYGGWYSWWGNTPCYFTAYGCGGYYGRYHYRPPARDYTIRPRSPERARPQKSEPKDEGTSSRARPKTDKPEN